MEIRLSGRTGLSLVGLVHCRYQSNNPVIMLNELLVMYQLSKLFSSNIIITNRVTSLSTTTGETVRAASIITGTHLAYPWANYQDGPSPVTHPSLK